MWCSPLYESRRPRALQMHTVVEQPASVDGEGAILCFPIGLEPLEYTWYGPANTPIRTEAGGSRAVGLCVGNYRVIVRDGEGSVADVAFDVRPTFADAAVIDAYRVVPASSACARDGSVEACGTGLQGWSFLWTNGVETTAPVLEDVPVGTYAAVPVRGGATCVHRCPPAVVGVVPIGEVSRGA